MRTKSFRLFVISLAVVAMGLTGYSVVRAQHNPDMNQLQAPENQGAGGGNTATCYSTYNAPIFDWNGTNIWRCGSCKSVVSKSHSDPGVCHFK